MFSNKVLYNLLIESFGEEFINNYEDNYECRLLTQKFVYIFQNINDLPNYQYSWYIAGPYSKELTNQMYNNIINADSEKYNEWNNSSFNEEGKKYIRRAKDIFQISDQECNENNLSKADWYELIASIYYLKEKDKIVDDNKLIDTLYLAKEKFTKEQIKFGLKKFKEKLGVG